MVLTSISKISSSSSFLSDSPLTSNSNYTLFRNRRSPFLVGFPKQPFSNATFKLKSSSSFSASSTQHEKGSLEKFIQFKKGGIDGATDLLQTSIVSYKKKFPWSLFKPFLQVDLVSMVHLADKEYFLALQKELESYDCVLFEMITSKEDLEIIQGSDDGGFNIGGCIQRLLGRILRLDFQEDYLDYKSKNWQNADLDIETFESLMQTKGESLFFSAKDLSIPDPSIPAPSIPEGLDPWRSKLLWASDVLPMPLVFSLIISGVCGELGIPASHSPEIEALSRLDFSGAMKVFFAKELVSKESTADEDEKSVVIGERNRVAIKSLRSAMDKGHNKIAILYGGGHMPDLERRLREEFDLFPSGMKWVTAWSISKKKVSNSSLLFLNTTAFLIFSSVLVVDFWFWKILYGIAVNWVYGVASVVLWFVASKFMLSTN